MTFTRETTKGKFSNWNQVYIQTGRHNIRFVGYRTYPEWNIMDSFTLVWFGLFCVIGALVVIL